MGLQLSRTQTKFATKEFIAATAAIFVAVLAMTAMTVQAGAESAQAGTVVVSPSNEKQLGWVQTEVGSGKIDYVTSAGALGADALQFSTNADGDYTRMRNDIVTNVALSSIASLSYKTKQLSGAEGVAAVNLRLYVDLDEDGDFDDVLVYEPYYNAVVTSGNWQPWEINQQTGKWWSNYEIKYGETSGTGAGGYATNFTLGDVVTSYPGAMIDEYGLGTGTSNFSWVVQADALKINDTTYNFERSETASAKDECKDGGFMNFKTAYKNQGQCVSAAASKKN